jgi:hypothetical protein
MSWPAFIAISVVGGGVVAGLWFGIGWVVGFAFLWRRGLRKLVYCIRVGILLFLVIMIWGIAAVIISPDANNNTPLSQLTYFVDNALLFLGGLGYHVERHYIKREGEPVKIPPMPILNRD